MCMSKRLHYGAIELQNCNPPSQIYVYTKLRIEGGGKTIAANNNDLYRPWMRLHSI